VSILGLWLGSKTEKETGILGTERLFLLKCRHLKKLTKCRISLIEAEVSHGMGSVERMNRLTPVKAIRKFCIQCAGNQKAPRHCDNKNCSLFDFRLGKNPGRAGIGAKRKSERFRQLELAKS